MSVTMGKELREALKSWMIDKWGVPLYSDGAFFRINGVVHKHVVLSYATQGGDSEARTKVASALKAALETLPARGLLVLRQNPEVYSDEDWDHDGKFYQSKGRVSWAYVRLAFIDGPTEDELMALDAHKDECQLAKILP